MKQVQHGGNLLQAIEDFGGQPKDWLDLSTGISPFTVELPEFSQNVWRRLPDAKYVELVESKAKAFYQTKSECLAVPGSQFAIQHLSKVLDGDVGIVEPTYGEYSASFARNSKSYTSLSGIDKIGSVSSVILANPNNPDGRLYTLRELLGLAIQLSERQGFLVVDEAFMTIDDRNSLLTILDKATNIIILRSIGKFFGLAGIRLGFVFSSNGVREKLAGYLGPWAVTGPALTIADHIFSYPVIAKKIKRENSARHREMAKMLDLSRMIIIGKNELFFLVQHTNVEDLHVYLKKQKILTRIFDYNSEWMRIGLTSNAEEDERLLHALNEFQNE